MANHIAGVAGEVSLVTGLGSRGENHESFIRSRFRENIDPVFFYFPNAPTVLNPKSIFGTTAGLLEQFGSKRVFDMPLAENGMTGVCIGVPWMAGDQLWYTNG